MAIIVKAKTEVKNTTAQPTSFQAPPLFRIPAITGARPTTPNIIIRAVKIMLMDIRMLIHPKQTKEELEKYSQFADMVYGRNR